MKYLIVIFALIGWASARTSVLYKLNSEDAKAIVEKWMSGEQANAKPLDLAAQKSITKRSLEEVGREADEKIKQFRDYLAGKCEDLRKKGEAAKASELKSTLEFVENFQAKIDDRLKNEDDETRKNILEYSKAVLDKMQKQLEELQKEEAE